MVGKRRLGGSITGLKNPPWRGKPARPPLDLNVF